LIDKNATEILGIYKTDAYLPQIVSKVLKRFTHKEDHSSLKTIEVQLDSLEFLLSTLPESLVEDLGPICLTLLSISQKIRREDIQTKAEELLQFI
jgi:hypothetical protein